MSWAGDEWEPGAEPERSPENRSADDMTAREIDAAFNELVADWHVDTVKAIRDAEKTLSSEDKEWRAALEPAEPAEFDGDEQVYLDEFHYVPPAPPPFPKLAAMTVLALLVLAASIVVLAAGGELGLSPGASLLLGVSGVLVAGGMFFTRLRLSRDDEDDDGTV